MGVYVRVGVCLGVGGIGGVGEGVGVFVCIRVCMFKMLPL